MKRLALFVATVLVPCGLLVDFGWVMIRQNRELDVRHADDQWRAVAQTTTAAKSGSLGGNEAGGGGSVRPVWFLWIPVISPWPAWIPSRWLKSWDTPHRGVQPEGRQPEDRGGTKNVFGRGVDRHSRRTWTASSERASWCLNWTHRRGDHRSRARA